MNNLYLDTNVILAFILTREGKNYNQARKIFEQIETGKIKIWVSILVIDETMWTIERVYKIKREQYLQSFIDLLSQKTIKIIEVKKRELFNIFKVMWQKNVSFPDAYLFYLSQQQGQIVSFDKDFVKLGAKIYKP